MALTIKDLFATVIAAGAAYIAYANINGISIPMFENPRVGITVMLIAGLLTCAATGTPINEANKNIYIAISSALGVLAFLIFLWGVVTGNRAAITVMGIDIVLLWAITTFRHLFKL